MNLISKLVQISTHIYSILELCLFTTSPCQVRRIKWDVIKTLPGWRVIQIFLFLQDNKLQLLLTFTLCLDPVYEN